MTLSVSSWFVDQTLLNVSQPQRQFTIGSSDYSERVLLWPTFKTTWNRVRAIKTTVNLANDDGGLNFLRTNPLSMQASCVLNLGFQENAHIETGAYDSIFNFLFAADSDFIFNNDGTKAYKSVDSPGAHAVYTYVLTTPWDISAIDSSSYVADWQASNPLWIAFGDSGLKFYECDPSPGVIYQHTLSTAYDLSTHSYDSVSFNPSELGAIYCMEFSSDGAKLFLGNSTTTIYQYSLSTPWDLSTASYDSVTLDLSSEMSSRKGIVFNNIGKRLLVLHHAGTVYQYALTTAYDLSTASYDNISLDVSGQISNGWGITLGNNDTKMYICQSPGYTYQYSVDVADMASIFTGTIDKVELKKGVCTLTMVDKFKAFSERVIGTSDAPVTYTGSNYLLSDIAWWLVTSYGGMSATQSSSNVDIDYDSFSAWASVFSADSVYLNARFTGMKVTEALAKLADISQSAIYQEENRLTFNRFSVINSNATTLDESLLKDVHLTIDDSKIVNRQYVGLNYSVDSNYFQSTVVDASSASVNSFGAREQIYNDESMWYVNSASALNYAQRVVSIYKEPYSELSTKSTLVGMLRQIGETVYITDGQTGLSSDAFRIMDRTLNMNTGEIVFGADASQLLGAFRLDFSALDSADILT